MSMMTATGCHNCGKFLKGLPVVVQRNDTCGECGCVHIYATCEECDRDIWKKMDSDKSSRTFSTELMPRKIR